ncbi:MAG: DMT family transporter, partial [Rhodospirillales bacterium]|nr:DMT family transporter [Rhodospirillales bacterium]
LIGRAVNEILPPIGLAFWRWMIALPIFLVLAWPHLKRDIGPALRHWPVMVLLALMSVTLYNTFIYIGLGSTEAINSMLINTSRPSMIVVMTYFLFRERISAVQALGLVLGLSGTTIIVLRGNFDFLGRVDLNQGDFWILGGTVSWAFYTVFLNKRPAIHATSFMAIIVMIGLVFLAPLYLWEAFYVEPMPLVPETFWAVGYLGIVASALAFFGFNRAVMLLGANRVGMMAYLSPVIGSAGAILLLGEQFHAYHGVGIAVILLGVYLGSKKPAMGKEAQ